MAQRIAALEHIVTWVLVPLPPHIIMITSKWVYIIKTHSDGFFEYYKAHIVARGFQQEHNCDYDVTYAPVAYMTTVHTLLVVASVCQWSIS
jgi:hypothetical protein